MLANLTLQKRITLLVLAGLVVVLGLFSWLGVQSLNESVARILDERLTIAGVMAHHLDETLSHVLRHMQSAADFNGRLPTGEQFTLITDSLRQILAESGISVRDILLADRDGKVLLVKSAGPGINETNISWYPEVDKALKTGLPTISNLVVEPLTGVPVVLATAPILSNEGKIIGVITGSIDIEQSSIGTFSQTLVMGKTGYTEVVDGNGLVLARSKPASPPDVLEQSDHPGRFANLISQDKATVGTCHRCHEAGEELKRRRDMLAFVPLSTASWGVAVRQSEEEAFAPTRQLERRFLSLGVLVLVGIFLLVWAMMQGIVRPLNLLTSATKKVAAGDFKAVVPVKRRDEIGELNNAFYTMTQELVRSRDELVSRNEELSTLNSITATISQSLDLEYILENALRKVREVTKTTAACVFLRDADSDKLEIKSSVGPMVMARCPEASSPAAQCACHQVLLHGETVMVNHVSQCPTLDKDEVRATDISCFVSVPLKCKDRILGIMNVACSSGRCFTENDFRLLDSIGYHVGLAIENSTLYEEAKQKEELRGQLLGGVISAQEEERKRVARELHDELGQILTALIMNIESLENVTQPQQAQLKEKLENVRSLAVRALEEMRRLTLDLRPSTLDDLGLVAAIRAHIHTHLESMGVGVEFQTKGLNQRLPSTVETAFFRIIQEAVNNITKHAKAHNVKIQLEVKKEKVTAVIEDDGQGFEVGAVLKSRAVVPALGLLGIQERTVLLGGTFSIQSQVGQGTRLVVEIPKVSALVESAESKQGETAPAELKSGGFRSNE